MDDEKYFSLTGDINSNRSYYTTDSSTTPYNVKFRCRTKFEPKILVWMAVSQQGMSRVYIHRSNGAINTETYLNECIRKRLVSFIDEFHSNDSILLWPDPATAHYAQAVQTIMKSIMFNDDKIHLMCHKLDQLKKYGVYWNRMYTRTIGKLKISIN